MNKNEWVASLKVGDVVEYCRGEQSSIQKIECKYLPKYPPAYRRVVFADCMPFWIGSLIDRIFCYLSHKFGNVYLADKTLTMSDGGVCSARYCCSPISKR